MTTWFRTTARAQCAQPLAFSSSKERYLQKVSPKSEGLPPVCRLFPMNGTRPAFQTVLSRVLAGFSIRTKRLDSISRRSISWTRSFLRIFLKAVFGKPRWSLGSRLVKGVPEVILVHIEIQSRPEQVRGHVEPRQARASIALNNACG